MKKVVYIVLVVLILLAISFFVKNDQATSEVIVENVPVAVEAVEEVIEVGETKDGAEVIDDVIIEEVAPVEDEALEVEETNPDETSDEDETIIKE